MIDVYKYIDRSLSYEALEFGIKLSLNYDRLVHINGEKRMFIRALLNPKDDPEKYGSENYNCLRLEAESEHCFIAEGELYDFGQPDPYLMDEYEKSVILAKDYTFGAYRQPECLIGTTVLPSNISLEKGPLGMPVLVPESDQLYLDNIIGQYKDLYPDINDTLLFTLYEKLVELGIFTIIARTDAGRVLYKDKEGRLYIVKSTDYNSFKKQEGT